MSAKTMSSSVQWSYASDPSRLVQRAGESPPLSARPRPRVKPEAAKIALTSQKGSVGLLFQPEAKAAPVYKRPEPKDHARENVRRMREIQEASKQRQKATSGPVRAVHERPPSRYEHVESKVAQHIKTENVPLAPRDRPRSASLVVKGSKSRQSPPPGVGHLDLSKVGRCDGPVQRHPEPAPAAVVVQGRSLSRPMSAPRPGRQSRKAERSSVESHAARPRSASLPRRSDYSTTTDGYQRASSSGRNFLAENVRKAASSQLRRSASVEHLQVLGARRTHEMESYRRGAVPSYLLKRQDEWRQEEAERIARRPDPRCPPGHIPLPSAERLHTLQQLNANHEELTRQLRALPIRTDTVRVQNRKTELEQTLLEMEEAIKIFSRPRVYVKE